MAWSEELATVAERYGIRDLYVFGSRAREIHDRVVAPERQAGGSSSDVDIAVQPVDGRVLSALDRVRLTDDLEVLFAVSRVDLVILAEASPLLAVDVIRGELLYTADPLAQARHELYVLRRAADLAPFLRERVTQIFTAGAR